MIKFLSTKVTSLLTSFFPGKVRMSEFEVGYNYRHEAPTAERGTAHNRVNYTEPINKAQLT